MEKKMKKVERIDKTCPKCGYEDSHLDYKKVGSTPSSDEEMRSLQKRGYCDLNDTRYYSARTNIECIVLSCRTCRYVWVSPVIGQDAPDIGSENG